MMDSFLDIPYVDVPVRDAFRELDIYVPKHDAHEEHVLPPLIVFVHGGAWRSEDKTDHKELARKLVSATRYPAAVINYRLTPRDPSSDGTHFRHPGHSEDALDALRFLQVWKGPTPEKPPVYDPNSMYLVGHSCSAHMLMSIFMDSSFVTPSLKPPTSLVNAVKGIVMSEGIYDLDLLLDSFPKYKEWFVGAAFGLQESLTEFSVIRFASLSQDIRWLVIHSRGDTLIDFVQSETVLGHLHKSIKEPDSHIFTNFTELTGEHDDILRTDTYIDILKDFILR